MVKKYRIIIVEDHTLFREGIKALLQTNPGFETVGEAEDGFNAIVITERLKPDLLLIDLSMPKMNGIEAIREIRNRCRQVKILAVTAYDEEELILAALQYGADGYVLKDATHEELLVGIKSVLSGKRYISSGISEKIIGGYLEGKKVMKARSSLETLTPQERVILKLIAEGWRNKEIAEHL